MSRRRKQTAWQKRGWVVPARRRKTRYAIPPPQYRPELKFLDEEVATKNFTTSWSNLMPGDNTISGVAQGDGDSDRDGRVYYINSIHMSMFCVSPADLATSQPQPDVIGRVMVVLDTQANETTVVASEIMNASFGEDYLAYRNLKFSKRFRVLWDKTFKLTHNGTTSQDGGGPITYSINQTSTPIFKFNKRFKKPIKVVTTDASGTIGGISDNAIVVIGSCNDATTFIHYHSRVRFTG